MKSIRQLRFAIQYTSPYMSVLYVSGYCWWNRLFMKGYISHRCCGTCPLPYSAAQSWCMNARPVPPAPTPSTAQTPACSRQRFPASPPYRCTCTWCTNIWKRKLIMRKKHSIFVWMSVWSVGGSIPELIDTGQDGDGSVPDVASVIHLPALHLHLGILQPQCDVAVIHVERTLVDRASSEGNKNSYRNHLQSTIQSLNRTDTELKLTSGPPSGSPPIVRTWSSCWWQFCSSWCCLQTPVLREKRWMCLDMYHNNATFRARTMANSCFSIW